MKKIISLILLTLLVSCNNEIKSNLLRNIPAKQEEKLSVDVFSLAFHKQMGNCDALPITHRIIEFSPISLSPIAQEYYIGTLELLLDDSTKVYKIRYREFPTSENPDQTVYESLLTGDFEVIKAQNTSTNDSLVLDNIGTVTPTIKGSTIGFILKLDNDLNRQILNYEVRGRVVYSSTPFITDNCLL